MMNTYKIVSAALFCVALTATQVQAQRPDTRYLTCQQARALVDANGAILLSTSRFKYNKYVKNHAYCTVNAALIKAYVPTHDSPRCYVGFTCRE